MPDEGPWVTKTILELEERIAELKEALFLTGQNMEHWAGYVDEYFLKKHDFEGDMKLYKDALNGKAGGDV